MALSYSPPEKSDRECKHWWFDMWDRMVNGVLKSAGTPHIQTSHGEIAMDPHVHSMFSHCSISQSEAIILRAAGLGLSAICVMDHNDIRGSLDAMECSDHLKEQGLIPGDFTVVPGVEINSDCGHIGALFVNEALPISLTVEQTVQMIHDLGGLAVAVHPYHSTGIKDAVFDAPFDAVEVECGSVFGAGLVNRNCALKDDPRLMNVTKFGSSDAHYINGIGSCYTLMSLEEPTLESVRAAIKNGTCSARSSEPCMRMRKMLGGISKLD